MNEWEQFIRDNFSLRHSPHMLFIRPAIKYAIARIRLDRAVEQFNELPALLAQ